MRKLPRVFFAFSVSVGPFLLSRRSHFFIGSILFLYFVLIYRQSVGNIEICIMCTFRMHCSSKIHINLLNPTGYVIHKQV
jgi:hypothetical protein